MWLIFYYFCTIVYLHCKQLRNSHYIFVYTRHYSWYSILRALSNRIPCSGRYQMSKLEYCRTDWTQYTLVLWGCLWGFFTSWGFYTLLLPSLGTISMSALTSLSWHLVFIFSSLSLFCCHSLISIQAFPKQTQKKKKEAKNQLTFSSKKG